MGEILVFLASFALAIDPMYDFSLCVASANLGIVTGSTAEGSRDSGCPFLEDVGLRQILGSGAGSAVRRTR